jgi:mono/diheme cytochrome c family protein
MNRKFFALAFAFAFAFAAPLASAQTSASATGSASVGKTLYAANCAACHLASGKGGVHLGSAISANLTAPGLETTYHHSDSLLLRAILEAKDQDDQPLDAPMPAWINTLTPAQALDIITYLHTLRG